jgi:predicted alpha/beta-fold hydrolase
VLHKAGYCVAAINFRTCGGTFNRGTKLYHSGFTEDLEHFLAQYGKEYKQVFLCGFSLGGSVVMNYLGKKYGADANPITAAAGISVPCDLLSGSLRLRKWYNYVYEQKFLSSLSRKIKTLSKINPEIYDAGAIKNIRSLMDFDDAYTAPIHGFTSGLDYYQKCSCLPVLQNISIPTLLINALDDSFLTPEAYPYEIAEENNQLFVATPRFGGHVGFTKIRAEVYWNERKVLDFFNAYAND